MMQKVKRFLLDETGTWPFEIYAGLTVAFALIPESISFAIVARVDPIIGLYTAFFMCLITAILGGRPGRISGATGAMSVAVVSLVVTHGVQYLFATVVLTGIFQILIGAFRLGKFIRILPKSVMIGFVNGLAIVIFVAVLHLFKFRADGELHWLTGIPLYIMIGLVIIGMAINYFLPMLTNKLPSALIAVIVVTALVYIFHLEVQDVDDMMSINLATYTLPTFAWLHIPFNLASVKIVVPYAITLCVIGLSESLMTLTLIDEVTNTRGRANKECIAQGIGNIVTGFFKGMGGSAMLGQSVMNLNSGGRGRLSGILAAVVLFIFFFFLWFAIRLIPLAALVAIMFIVVIKTFEWSTFRIIHKIPKHDALIIIVVTVVTVITDLAIAVIAGVVVSALVFAWNTAKNIYADKNINKDGALEYKLNGPLFFGSAAQFKALFDVEKDPKEVIIDFMNSRIIDHSAINAIQFVTERYVTHGKKLHLRHLSPECKVLLKQAGNMVETNIIEDPNYHVSSNKLD